jgi:sigma-E factor negative regulatory protein RseA
MKNPMEQSTDNISALVDGCLMGDELAAALNDVLTHPASMQTWHVYHVVGDVLRSAELAPSHVDIAFWERLEKRLQDEPVAPSFIAPDADVPRVSTLDSRLRSGATSQSANATLFRWKLLSGVACTALVGVLTMSLWNIVGTPASENIAAISTTPRPLPALVDGGANAAVMIRDPRLDELMAAHRQLGGHSAFQVPAGFIRNATFEGNAR